MKILVSTKRVPDPETRIKIKPDKSGIQTEGVKYVNNPFDENAIEEALRQAEKHKAETVVVSIGGPEVVEQIRTALAMGIDRGVHVKTDGPVDPDAAARLLAKVAQAEGYDLFFCGKQAIDDDASQTPQLLAQYLGVPQATFAYKVEIAGDDVTVVREVDGGLETVKLKKPAVVTMDLRVNEPRYASLPGIMKAKKKEVKEMTPASLGVDTSPKVKTLSVDAPPARKGGRKVESVDALIDILRNEAKVI